MTDPRINSINQLRGLAENTKRDGIGTKVKPEVSFKETMKQYLRDANDLQLKADNDIKRIIAGEDIDPHEVMIAVEKANLSFELVMELRNKMLEAYREVMRTSV